MTKFLFFNQIQDKEDILYIEILFELFTRFISTHRYKNCNNPWSHIFINSFPNLLS